MPSSSSEDNATTQTVRIDLGERSYDIHIGATLLDSPDLFKDLPKAASVLIVSNDTVGPLYLNRLRSNIAQKYKKVFAVELPDGEEHKNWKTLNQIFDVLLQNGCDRKTIIFALGGGVVGDMAGFAAATYLRGVSYVQLPTTLLAQVDSSVGGKTGINHPLGKNMMGAFYQPLRVVCDTDLLATLPRRQMSAGLAEVIKYGPIFDMEFFDWIEKNLDALLAGDSVSLAYAVKRSCEIKASVVASDERETGRRAILNFGHTFGHAIETGLGHGKWLHGEAVGCGMLMAARLSHALGLVDQAFVRRLSLLVRRAGLPVVAPDLGIERYMDLMRVDKKADAGEIRFVLIDGPGHAVVQAAPAEAVAQVLRESVCAAYDSSFPV